jgi:hypothetical protein
LADAVITTRSFARNERSVEESWLAAGDAFGKAIAAAISGQTDPQSARDRAQALIKTIHVGA